MDFLLARIDQLEKDKTKLLKENINYELENRRLKDQLRDEQIKVRLLSAKDEIIHDRTNEEYFNSKKIKK
tara:strand:- start:8654 stop:8863 length:210 start_codon:yes stop_codon:yes gene_type:complete